MVMSANSFRVLTELPVAQSPQSQPEPHLYFPVIDCPDQKAA